MIAWTERDARIGLFLIQIKSASFLASPLSPSRSVRIRRKKHSRGERARERESARERGRERERERERERKREAVTRRGGGGGGGMMRRGDGEISLISECRPGNRLSISDLRGIADLTQFLRFFLSFSLSLSFSPRPLPFLCLPSREVSSRARVLANANVEEVRCVRNLDRIRISGTLINAFRDPSCSADAIIYGALTVPLSLSLSLSVSVSLSVLVAAVT